jgi:hypothetical protein
LSPPVVNWIDCTWFGTANTCAFSGPKVDSACHSKNQVKRSGRRNCPYSALTALMVPKNTVASIILKWKKFGFFLELATRPNWTIGGEWPWSGRWPRTRKSLWQSSRVPLWRWENLPEGQLSLRHLW